ncbi:MAG: hypothetical protein H0U16_06705 [Actinobacteria bacterium]|nr:hypothetical protein [Actinomycetota bacterium]
MRSFRLFLTGTLTILVLSGPFGGTGAHATRDILEPESGALLGAWVQNGELPSHYDEVVAFEQELGRQLDIAHIYRPWDNLWWNEEEDHLADGRIPLISWTAAGTTAAEINSGSQDGLIAEKADAIKALGTPVFLRFSYEMDQPPSGPRYIGPPEQFIPAWRRVHDIFVARGATNAVWVWCAIAWNFSPKAQIKAPDFYPGNAYVDWIAADGYNWYPEKPGSKWKSFTEIFTYFYDWAAPKGKPIMIGENGVQEDPAQPGRKAGWLRDTAAAMKAMPLVKSYVYFHSMSPKGYNFRLDTSGSAFGAFTDLAMDPYYNQGPPPPPPPDPLPELFEDGFESGDLSEWTSAEGMEVGSEETRTGSYAARQRSVGSATYAVANLDSARTDLTYRIWFKVISQATTTTLIRFQSTDLPSLFSLNLRGNGDLAFWNGYTLSSTVSSTGVDPGAWHDLRVHLLIAGVASEVTVELDGVIVDDLSSTLSLGSQPLTSVQLGNSALERTYDVAFDDVSVTAP